MTIGLSPITSVEQAFAWVDAGGTVHALGGASGYDVLAALSGRWFPPAAWIEERAPGIPGTILLGNEVKSLDFPLPLLVTGTGAAQLHQRLRDLMYWTDPRRGDCWFRATAPDATTRQIRVRVRSVDVPEDGGNRGFDWQRVILDLHAPEAYWEATEPEEATYNQNFGVPAVFLNPVSFFPLNLTGNVLFAGPVIDNLGDTESWPTWQITGPGTNPSLRNLDTGEQMTFTRTLGVGEIILIELTRSSVIVTDAFGTRLYSTMTNPSVPWPIRPGLNHAHLGMSDATSASSIALSYTPRFIGP